MHKLGELLPTHTCLNTDKIGGIHPGELLGFTQVNSSHHSWVNLAHSLIDELMNNSLIHLKMGEW
jgi:hypothetical protein